MGTAYLLVEPGADLCCLKSSPDQVEGAGTQLVQARRVPKSVWRRAVYSFILVAAVVVFGTLAMHFIEGWSYLDSIYFTSFIATGQGPPPNLAPNDEAGKLFASLLAFVSVGTVITALLFIFGPFLGRVIREGGEKLEEIGREVEEFERG